MICVTEASGTVSSEVIKQLKVAKTPFRAAYFSRQKATAARTRGIDAVVIDYSNPETLRAAFQGCDKLFLLGPTLPNQTQLELNGVETAEQAGVQLIVKQSVMCADEEKYTLARLHRAVERGIESSRMAWTFLRSNSFMQNAITFMGGTIRAESMFYSSSGDARISHVDVRDIAAVAVRALTGTNHEKKAYTITGPQAITYDELAGELSKALGRMIHHVNLSPEDMKAGMLA
ncbi:MAG: NAD(P)H-binding protein [Nitrospira sp.]|nr:NAD(P)H-binding protein [Nitrospira sp.]